MTYKLVFLHYSFVKGIHREFMSFRRDTTDWEQFQNNRCYFLALTVFPVHYYTWTTTIFLAQGTGVSHGYTTLSLAKHTGLSPTDKQLYLRLFFSLHPPHSLISLYSRHHCTTNQGLSSLLHLSSHPPPLFLSLVSHLTHTFYLSLWRLSFHFSMVLDPSRSR